MPKKSRAKTPEPISTQDARKTFPERWAWILVAGAILFVAAIRIRLANMPLERDEGEFAYMGQLMLQGIPPYKLAYNMKFPGIYLAYALVLGIFGQSIAAVHIGVMIANIIALVLLFIIAKRLFDPLTGAIAAITFGLLSVGSSVLGIAGHATQYVLPFALGGILMLLKGIESRKAASFLWSGLLLGIAILMKQHAALFVAFAVLYLLWSELRARPVLWKRAVGCAAILGGSSLVPFALTCVWLYAAGVFQTFWFWTFTYARAYVTRLPLKLGMYAFTMSSTMVIRPVTWMWLLAAVGLTAFFWSEKARRQWPFLVGFTLFSFLAVCPGMFFRNQYFILLLPAVGMLTGVAVTSAMDALSESKDWRWLRIVPGIAFALAVLSAINNQAGIFFQATPAQACRMTYSSNPFPESVEIAKYIREHSSENDTVAVLGSEPQICFYSRRHSATGFIYVYGLMENQPYASQMQRDMIREIEAAEPKFIVFTAVSMSWLKLPTSDTTILRWARDYTSRYYHPVGLMDIISEDYTASYWGPDAGLVRPQSTDNMFVYVFERNSG